MEFGQQFTGDSFVEYDAGRFKSTRYWLASSSTSAAPAAPSPPPPPPPPPAASGDPDVPGRVGDPDDRGLPASAASAAPAAGTETGLIN